jgi:hypothetical protein
MEVLTVVLRLTELNFTFEVNTVFCRLDHSTTRRLNHPRHAATRYSSAHLTRYTHSSTETVLDVIDYNQISNAKHKLQC